MERFDLLALGGAALRRYFLQYFLHPLGECAVEVAAVEVNVTTAIEAAAGRDALAVGAIAETEDPPRQGREKA